VVHHAIDSAKIETVFRSKKDRHVVELAIEFNLSAIHEWLDKGGEIKDTEKMAKDWDSDAVIQSYFIDVLPNGNMSDMYFHRRKGIISSNVGGVDYFENVDENLKRFLNNTKIERLSWNYWRTSLGLTANQKPVLCVPLAELAKLQVAGEFEKGGYFEKAQKIKVPISYESAFENKPKEFIEVWRASNSPRSVGYKNALASVAASTLNFEVEY